MTGSQQLAAALVLAASIGPPSVAAQETEVLGQGAAFSFEGSESETIDLAAETRLFQHPDARARVLDVLVSSTRTEVLERLDSWAKVRHGTWRGWVWTAGELPVEATTRLALPPARPDKERLARARGLLGERERTGRLGPFRVYTDVDDPAVLAILSTAAADVTRAYAERYGLEPHLDGEETIVLFRRASDYRRYEADEPAIAGLDTLGHTTSSLSVLFVGSRPTDGTRQLLLHELVHLLNGRALGLRVAPWIEEGLAEDLSFCAIGADGRLRLGSLGAQGPTVATVVRGKQGALKLQSPRTKITNPFGATPKASLAWLLHEWNNPARPSLELLLDLPWVGFVQPGFRQFYYGQSGFFVRYLLEEDRGRHAAALRQHLASIAAGQAVSSQDLWRALDDSPAQLEERLYRWLWRQAGANGIPTQGG